MQRKRTAILLGLLMVALAAPTAAPAKVIRGTAGDDVLVGTPKADRIFGGGGNDVIRGKRGNDRIYGGRGDDVIYGGRGSNRLVGGAGDDVIRSAGSGRFERIFCGAGTDLALVMGNPLRAYLYDCEAAG